MLFEKPLQKLSHNASSNKQWRMPWSVEEAQIISMLRLSVCLCVCMAEALQTQTESLEKSRLKQLRILEDRRSTGETPSQAQSTQQVSLLSVSLHIEYAIEQSNVQFAQFSES